jgi:hypothetical protein
MMGVEIVSSGELPGRLRPIWRLVEMGLKVKVEKSR